MCVLFNLETVIFKAIVKLLVSVVIEEVGTALAIQLLLFV
jgi:hypothetical protein